MFVPGGSPSKKSSSEHASIQHSPPENKQTICSKVFAPQMPKDDEQLKSRAEVKGVAESAIVENDSDDDWEDSLDEDLDEENGQAIFDETCFERVDSQLKLTSHKSLLTMQFAASRSTPTLHRSNTFPEAGLWKLSSLDSANIFPLVLNESPVVSVLQQTKSQPVQALPLSPSTARRNLLAKELPVCLRQNLLWEHQQTSRTTDAILERRYTAQDFTAPQQKPKKIRMEEVAYVEYTNARASDYNSKGW